MKQLGISIIGTDTDVGKTFVTGLLGAMAVDDGFAVGMVDRKSTRLNSSHGWTSRMPSSA